MSTTKREREEIYNRVFRLLIDLKVDTLPTPIERLRAHYNVRIVPLTEIMQNLNMTKRAVLRLWGNPNGHLMPLIDGEKTSYKIAYNNIDFNRGRELFTIMEELCHILLGHYKHPMYRIDNFSNWDERIYQKHEEQARIAAGLLLCPPPIFYNNPNMINKADIERLCYVSNGCAETRRDVLLRFRSEIISHPLYDELSMQFNTSAPPRRHKSPSITRKEG